MRHLFRTRARLRVGVITTVAVAVLAGCAGSRVSHDRVVAVGNGYGPSEAEQDRSLIDAAAEAAAAKMAARIPTVAAASRIDPGPDAPAAAAGGDAGSGTTATGTAVSPQVGGRAATDAGPTAPASGSADRCTAVLSPIRLGQTLATSGLIGAAIGGLRTGVAVWAKEVNARGGVQCHPIELTQLDDASDPARVATNWNNLVHVRGDVAVMGAGTPVAIAALRSSAERDKVPVVGADLNAEDYFDSPYLFPQGGLPLTAYDGSYLLAAQATGGGGTAGLIYCVEVSICTGVKNNHTKAAERAGLKVGPMVAASLTQPDFTSECQTMKQAGVTVLFLAMDGSASIRASRSCTSLGYKPAIASSAIAISAQAAADQTLRSLGVYLGTNNVPYMSDSPAAAGFRAAMARYAPSAQLEEQALFGYASGKLFEAALAKVADRARAGDVSTQLVLDGLWQLKNETLGGLGPGVSFTKGNPVTAQDCFYGLKLASAGYSAPIGAAPMCFDKNGKASRRGASGSPTQIELRDGQVGLTRD